MNIKEFIQDNKDEYDFLLENLVQGYGVRLAHVFNRHAGTPKGGLTIAYRPVNPDLKNCRNYQVAAVYCSKDDVYSKKIGNLFALRAFENGQYTNYNLGTVSPDHAGSHLKWAFGMGISDGEMQWEPPTPYSSVVG